MVTSHTSRFSHPAPLACLALIFAAGNCHAIVSPDAPSWGTNAKAPRPPHAAAAKFAMRSKPNFDIRIGGEKGEALPFVVAARELAFTQDHLDARDAALARLRENVPDLTVDFDQFSGTISSVRSWQQRLSGDADALTAFPSLSKVYAFLDSYADAFGITSEDLQSARLRRNYVTDFNGVHHYTFVQQYNGVDIHDAVVICNLDRTGRVINFGSTFLTTLDKQEVPLPTLSAAEALRLAAADVGVIIKSPLVPIIEHEANEATANAIGSATGSAAPTANQRTRWENITELAAHEPIITRLAYFPRTALDLRPAWEVVVPLKGVGHTYDTFIDAVTGEVLKRSDRLVWDTTQPATYRIFPSDSPAPGSPSLATASTTQFPFIGTRNLVVVTPEEISQFSPNGWIPDGSTTTLGNNINAYADLAGNNSVGSRPNGGASRVFDFPYNDTQAPGQWTNAAVTQMFYWANRYHDRLYSLGFNEVAGNFQTSNLGLGGIANDAILAEGQDGSFFNNANWNSTGEDGSSARMQMFLFDGPTPDRDGTVEGDVVVHELTHGLSIRLHQGITANVTRGMGEGWSDYFGVSMFAEPTDDFNANYCVGGYVTRQMFSDTYLQNYYFGIRRFPYSTNVNINPQTLADIDPNQQNYPPAIPRNIDVGNTADLVHNMGEVWCNTLLEGRTAMYARLGFAANERMMRLVVDGMKLHPVQNPNFLQARDAILQGDSVTFNGANTADLWSAFAKRGMGFRATAPASTTSSPIVENFETPFFITFATPNGVPTIIAPRTSTDVSVVVTPTNLILTPDSGLLHYSINGADFVTTPMVASSLTQYTATIPAQDCFAQVRYFFSVGTDRGIQREPNNTLATARLVEVFSRIDYALQETGETDEGWTVTNSGTLSAGRWERATPVFGNRADPSTDFDRVGTGKCWLTQNNLSAAQNDTDVDNGSTFLTSRPLDARTGDSLTYSYWVNTTSASTLTASDGLRVDYSTNGTTWTNVRTYTTPSSTWRTESFTIGGTTAPIIPASPTLRLRFVASDTPTNGGNLVEAAVDGVSISRRVCDEVTCFADFNNDGGVDGFDVESFFNAWQASDTSADTNLDGGVDGSDVETFFLQWSVGGC